MRVTEESYRPAGVAILNTLPDEIFREIFTFCLSGLYLDTTKHMKSWKRLAHVCQRWRQIIRGSPRSLGLYICSYFRSSFRKRLRCWPEFPILISHRIPRDGGNDDLIAALEHPDRVLHVNLEISSPEVKEVLEMMKVPFPALKVFHLTGPSLDSEEDEYTSIFELPDDFLGGSAQSLQHLFLKVIALPGLPKLLSSARRLVSLHLRPLPATGPSHISPEAMVGALAGLTWLEILSIELRSPHRQRRRLPDPPIRVVLPALTKFEFEGENEYLEDLVAQIDTPRVKEINIQSFMREVETRQLSQFIGRAANFELAHFRAADVVVLSDHASIELDRTEHNQAHFSLIMSPESDFSIPCMTRVLGQFIAMLCNVGHLSIYGPHHEEFRRGLDSMYKTELLTLLHLFPAVGTLHASGALAVDIISALQDIVEEKVTEVLPALTLLLLGDGVGPVGPPERFLSLCRLSSRPVAILNFN
jgi:hypothetical protein